MSFPRYPVFLSLENARCLVIGGGSVGERKIRTLLSHGAKVFVLSRELTPFLGECVRKSYLTHLENEYNPASLEEMDLVFAATSDRELNRRIAADARERRLWCNAASNPKEGSFIVPSVIHRGSLSVAISTGGASPAIARQIREQLEGQFGQEWGRLLRFMELLREKIQAKGLESSQNQDLFKKVSRLPLLEWMQDQGEYKAIQTLSKTCAPLLTPTEIESLWKEAWNPSF